MSGPAPAAALFDLDDTLVPQEQWLRGAWAAVAARASRDYDLPEAEFRAALESVSSAGSAQGNIIDNALLMIRRTAPVAALVKEFLAYRAPVLKCYPGVKRMLSALRGQVRLGIITDGFVPAQKGKLESAGLLDAVETVVFSDLLGRECRKPHPAPFLEAARRLRTSPERVLVIGDRPDKDIAGALAAGMRAVRVRTGEYREMADHPGTAAVHLGVVEACAALWPALALPR